MWLSHNFVAIAFFQASRSLRFLIYDLFDSFEGLQLKRLRYTVYRKQINTLDGICPDYAKFIYIILHPTDFYMALPTV